MNQKQKQVYNILLKQIECSKKYSSIYLKDNKILTGQTYYCNADEDMSDFAIGFYKIIYKNILPENELLDKDGYLLDMEFAGDTMNSFNSIANITPNAGNTKNNRTPAKNWPDNLRKYYNMYHCLANFWIIPMSIGRRSKKLNQYDSVDIFINKIKTDSSILSQYKSYFKKIKLDCFKGNHYIQKARDESKIYKMYKNKDSTTLIYNSISDIINRAYKISKSEHMNNLWNYFNNLNLF